MTRTDEFACVDNNDGKGCVTTYAWVGCYLEGNSCIKEESNVTIPCGSGGGGGSTCSNSDWTAPQFIAIHWSTGTGGKMKATISFTSGGANTVSIGASSNWVSATAYCNPAFGALDGCIIFTGLGGNGTNVSSPLVVDGFTKKYQVDRLVWYEVHETMESAIQREKAIKEWQRAWKLKLIEEFNPDWKDLYDTVC